MPAFIELLPPTKSEPHGAIEFVPCEDAADRFVIGVLTITGRRCHARYKIAEYSTGHAGRGFMLFKMDAGSDKEESRYGCLTTAGGRVVECECRGWAAHGGCKHARAIECLISNGQL